MRPSFETFGPCGAKHHQDEVLSLLKRSPCPIPYDEPHGFVTKMVAVKRKATPNVEKEVRDDNGIRLDLEHRSFYRLSLLATRINRAIASGYVKNFGRPAHAWKVVTILGAFGPMSA